MSTCFYFCLFRVHLELDWVLRVLKKNDRKCWFGIVLQWFVVGVTPTLIRSYPHIYMYLSCFFLHCGLSIGTFNCCWKLSAIVYLNGSYIFFCLLYSSLFLICFVLDCCYSKASSSQCWSAHWYHCYLMNQDKFNVNRCF